MNIEQKIMEMIAYSGESRSYATKGIHRAAEGSFEEAEELIRQSEESLLNAHQRHTDLLVYEAQGNPLEISMLLIHATQHLAIAEVMNQMACETITILKGGKSDV